MTDTDTITLPAGTYFLGDPCYAVRNEDWIPWLEAADYTRQHDVLDATIRGHRVVAFGTMYGDGEYAGSDGRLYGVDAGLIGLVPAEVAENVSDHLARRITFDSPVACWATEEGTIHLGDVAIITGDEEHEDYEDEEQDA